MSSICERKREIKRRRHRKQARLKARIADSKAQAAKAKKAKPA